VAQSVRALRYKPEGRGVRFPVGSLEFFIDIIFPALGSTQPLTEMRRPLGRADNTFMFGLKIWESEPSGTLRASTGIALPLIVI